MMFQILDHVKRNFEGKYCGFKSYLTFQKIEKICFYYLHHQYFH